MLAGLVSFGSASGQVGFRSVRYHYSVTYPSSWHPCEGSLEYLELCNFPWAKRVHGVVIPPHGAIISVAGAPQGVISVEDWVRHDTMPDDTVVVDHALEASPSVANGCAMLRERVYDTEVGPNVYQRSTSIYCGTSKGVYAVALSNWKGDPTEEAYRAVALEIARSLRTFE